MSGADRAAGQVAVVDLAQKTTLTLIVVANLLFPLFVLLSDVEHPWRPFEGEKSPINWFSSLQCAILGVIALGVFFVTRAGRRAGSDPIDRDWPWLLVSFGFAFLSFDEKFQIHERVREEFLKPHGIFTGIRGFKAGDIVLLGYVAAGAVVAWYLLSDLKRYRRAMILFFSALALIGFLAFQDALQLAVLNQRTVRHVQIIAEEVGEVWAQVLFAFSLLTVFFAKLRALIARVVC